MSTPKHKIFFGIPDQDSASSKVVLGDGTAKQPVLEPCWTWDSDVFSLDSNSKGFDCDRDVTELEAGFLDTGFSWDTEVIKLDSNALIYS